MRSQPASLHLSRSTRSLRPRPSLYTSRTFFMAGTPNSEYQFLFVTPDLRSGGVGSEPRLRAFTERHAITLHAPQMEPIGDPITAMNRSEVAAVVLSMSTGLPNLDQLRVAAHVLSHRARVWFYW